MLEPYEYEDFMDYCENKYDNAEEYNNGMSREYIPDPEEENYD